MTQSKAAKRPESIRIFGRTYTLIYTTTEALEGSYGLCDKINQLCHIATDTGDEELKDTVLHEALHAARWVTKTELRDAKAEEAAVTSFAAIVVGILQDNPEFAQWLSQKAA